MMRCDCRNEQLCKTAELQKAPSAQSSSKILELAKGKENSVLGWPQASLNEKLSAIRYYKEEPTFKGKP